MLLPVLLLALVRPVPAAVPVSLPVSLSGAEGPEVLLEGLDGTVRRVPAEAVELTDPRQEGAVLLRFSGFDEAPAPAGEAEDRALLTVSGDRIEGWVRGGEGDRLGLALVGGSELSLLVDQLSAISWPGRLPRDVDAAPEPAEEGDRIYLLRRGGLDRLDGLLAGFSAEGIAFESQLGLETHAWDQVVALFIEAFELPPGGEATGGAPVVVDLRGGSRLRGRLVRLDGEGLRLSTQAQEELLLPLPLLESVVVDDGSFRFLSELEPVDRGPLSPTGDELGMTWPPRVDRAVDGRPLRAGGRTWSRGLGVHAPSRLTWALDGSWSELRTRAAVDDQVSSGSHRGSVVFRVHVDGELRYESRVVGAGEPVLELPAIELTGARELVLEVDPTADLWIGDRADWLSPVLVAAR